MMLPGHDKKRSPKFVDLTFSHDLVAFVVLIVQLFHMLLQLLDLPWMWHREGYVFLAWNKETLNFL